MFRKGLGAREMFLAQLLLDSADALEHFATECTTDEVFGIKTFENGDCVGSKTLPFAAIGHGLKIPHRQLAEFDCAIMHGKNHIYPSSQIAIKGLVSKNQLKFVAGLD